MRMIRALTSVGQVGFNYGNLKGEENRLFGPVANHPERTSGLRLVQGCGMRQWWRCLTKSPTRMVCMDTKKAFAALALIGLFGIITACGEQEDPEMTPPEAGAEEGAPAPGDQMDPEMMELITEAQELEQRLAPIQQEAMEDENLASQLDDLQDRVEAAMREENPELVDRMDQLQADFIAAQEAGDQERAQEIGTEAQTVQAEFQALQQSVLSRQDISDSIEAFEDEQRARMIEIDPEVVEIMDRMDEIFAELQLQ